MVSNTTVGDVADGQRADVEREPSFAAAVEWPTEPLAVRTSTTPIWDELVREYGAVYEFTVPTYAEITAPRHAIRPDPPFGL